MTEKPDTTPPSAPLSESVEKPRPFAKWASILKYDPDEGCRAEDFQTKSDEYEKRFHIRESITPEKGDTVYPELEGVLLVPEESSRRWVPQRFTTVLEVREFFYNSERGKHKRYLEQFGSEFGDFDPTQFPAPSHLFDREFVPLMWGPFYKQLYVYDYLNMHARAFELVNHNALAAAAVKIMTRFTLGRGVSFLIKDPRAQAIWDEFWDRNNMRKKLRQMARDLTWQGELMLRYYEGEDGRLTMKVVDPSSCWEVVTDPEDLEKVYYFHFQWPAPWQIWTSGKIPVTKYIIQQIPPTNLQHIKINVSAQEKRGRSDFMPAMPWLKRFNDYYNGATLEQVLKANLVWKVKVLGDQSDVDAIMNDPKLTEMPPPGGVWVENPAVELSPMTAQIGTAGRGQGIGGQIAAIVATSLNLPNEYFNIESGAGGARATALVRTDPAVKAIEDRQQILREAVEEIYQRVMQAALSKGLLSGVSAREEPEMASEEPPRRTRPARDDADDDDETLVRVSD